MSHQSHSRKFLPNLCSREFIADGVCVAKVRSRACHPSVSLKGTPRGLEPLLNATTTMTTNPQSVSFPITDPAHLPAPVTHLPFRRISLPSAPTSSFLSAQHRQSAASIISFELQEEPVVRHHRRRSLNRRHSRTLTPVDAAREAKRAKVVREFWDTERSYVEGLDLVHDVSIPPPDLKRADFWSAFSNTDHCISR